MVPFARPIGTTVSLRSGGRAALSRACSIRDMRRPNAFFTSAIVKPRRLASGGSSSRRQASSQFFGGPITYSNSSTTPIGVCLEIETFWAKQFVKRSEEHTSELQSLMRISYAVFCLKKKNKIIHIYILHLIIYNN